MKIKLGDLARAVDGSLTGSDTQVQSVTVDSREAGPGALFVALTGIHTDGHRFVLDAARRGAAAALVQQNAVSSAPIPLVGVNDTQRALEELAAWFRQGFSCPVVGVTGSTGKTTVKEMTAAALGAEAPVLSTRGNYNTEIGLPLTLFSLEEEHRAVVLEMAMRAPGQIRRLAQIARPQVGLITQIGVTHLEKLGSRDAIARAKGELLEELTSHGTAVLWRDDPYFPLLASRTRASVISFGWQANADLKPREVSSVPGALEFIADTPWGEQRLHLTALGKHNVMNALAALAAGGALGWSLESMARGLGNYRPPQQRLQLKKGLSGSVIVDDTYNANPDSAARGLDALMETRGEGRAVAVLGDMLELGAESGRRHYEIGSYAADLGIDCLLVLGDYREQLAEGARERGIPEQRILVLESRSQAIAALKELLGPGDVCLIKASRGLALEKVVQALTGEIVVHPGGES